MRPPSPLAGSSLGPLRGGAAAGLGLHCASEGLTRAFKVSCAASPPALSLHPSHTAGAVSSAHVSGHLRASASQENVKTVLPM